MRRALIYDIIHKGYKQVERVRVDRQNVVNFQEVDRRYAELKRQYDAGSLSAAEFDAQLQRLMIQDGEGRWWAKARDTGEWHYHDGRTWIRTSTPQVAPQGRAFAGIKGTEGMDVDQLNFELSRGAKFVVFQYCISVIILTFRRSSDIYFFKPEKSRMGQAWLFTAISLILGWWGIPWGPIYTVQTIIANLTGGKDVTQEVISSLNSANRTR